MELRNNLSSVIQKLIAGGYDITTVYDVGANKGMWTAHHEQEIRNAQFILFEANPNQPRPNSLISKHKWFNVVLSSPEIKEVDFYAVVGTGDSYYKERTHVYDNVEPLKLPTKTLDEMVKTQSLPLPQLVKLDTQGSELDILCGAKAVIEHVDIIVTEVAMLEYNRGAPTFDDYMEYLSSFGFVPMGLEGFHFVDNMLAQLDIVFLKQDVKTKYYGDQKLFKS